MPAIEIKLIVVLDTTVAEGAKFDFDIGTLEGIKDEAMSGSLKIALTEVQVEEMRAHINEQVDGLKSVAKALQAGAGRKRITSNTAKENEGIAIPRLFGNPKVRDALNSIAKPGGDVVTAFEAFLAKPYVLTISCGDVP